MQDKEMPMTRTIAALFCAIMLCAFSSPIFAQVSSGGSGAAVQTLTIASVQTLTIASGVTTNTTTAAVAGVSGTKTFWGEVVCSSGACTQTIEIRGDQNNDAANGVLICTITLSGTPRDQNGDCSGSTASYPYYYVVTTSTTGNDATGAVYANY